MRLCRKVYEGKDLRNRKVFNLERKDVLERTKGDTDEDKSKQALSEEKDRSSREREFQIRGAASLKERLVIFKLEPGEGS